MTRASEHPADTTPSVTLNGKEWPIPQLSWAQLRHCRRELIDLNAMINAALSDSTPGTGESTRERGLRQMDVMAKVLDGLSDDDCERLVMGPIYAALTAALPSLTRQEFDAWPLTETERQLAWLTVRRQSLLFLFEEEEAA